MNTQPLKTLFSRRVLPLLGLALMTAATARADYHSAVLADGPLAYYALNPATDGTSVAPDLSGNGNDGVAVGIAEAVGPSKYLTNAAYFNGSAAIDLSQGVNSGLLDFSGPITIEAWAQPSSSSLFGNIVAKGYDASTYQEIVLRVNGPYGANYYGSSGSVGVNGGSQTTNWTYVVLTSDGVTCSLYQNGTLVQRSADTAGSIVFGDGWMIGNGSSAGSTRFFNGNISEVAIYAHGLTAGQVLNHYYEGLLNTSSSNSAPIIVTQPQPQTTYLGGSATFTVSVISAFPTTNQWYRAGSPLQGQTNASLTLTGVGAGDAVNYSVVVGNQIGTTNSASVSLTLLTPGPALQWSANANSGVWDSGTSPNWINQATSAQTVFSANDQVLFDDTVGVPTTVTVNGSVAPSIMTVDSTANAYTFSGSGPITGAGSLVKKGSSTLTLNTGVGLTGPATIGGGKVVGANSAFNSFSTVTVTNGGIMDFAGAGMTSGKPITLSNGTIFNSGGAQYGQVFKITLAGDGTFGGSNRWDLSSGSQIQGTGNLSLDWSAGAGYGEWNGVTLGTNLGAITLVSGNFGMKNMDSAFQNGATVFTVNTNSELSFWSGGWNGSLHVRSHARVDLWTAPAAFSGSSIFLDDGAMWYSWGSSSSDEPINSTVTLNGVAHFVLGDHNLVYTNIISGSGGFLLDYWNHQVVLSASNTYSGPTIIGSSGNNPSVALTGNGSISHSSLIFFGGNDLSVVHVDATGRSDQTLTLAGGQTLAGIGAINGGLVVAAGATVAPGGTNTTIGITAGSNTVGTIAAFSDITLGGTTVIKLAGNGSNDVVQSSGTINYGGTLNLVNVSGAPLAVGDSFQIFNAGVRSGSFSSITPVSPGAGLAWDTSLLSGGVISVIAGATPPLIGNPSISGSSLILSGTGGTPNANYVVLSTTNIAAAPADWIPVTTNMFDSNGNFSWTNALTPGVSQSFYRIKQ